MISKNASARMESSQPDDEVVSPNAATRVTNITEVMGIINEHVDSKSLASCARVNRCWSEHALDRIWSEVLSIFPLLELLGEVQHIDGTGWTLTSAITPEALSRFYFYTSHIRSLSLGNTPSHKGRSPRVCISSFLQVFTTNPPCLPPSHGGHIFPRLRQLRYFTKKSHPPIQTLLSPTVKVLNIWVVLDVSDAAPRTAFRSLTLRDLKGLEELLINARANSVVPGILAVLAESTHLKSLTLMTAFGSPFGPESMRIIEQLHNLRYLFLEPGIEFERKEDVHQGIQTLVEGCPDLEHLLAGMTCQWAQVSSYLGLEDIRPLLRLKQIQTLILDGNLPIVLQASDVAEIGRSWSHIQAMSLCAVPQHPSQAPGTSLEILASFKELFPSTLQKLGLYFKVPGPDVLRKSYPEGEGLASLKILSTGNTRSSGDMLDVGDFLGHILPRGVSLLTGLVCSLDLQDFPDEAPDYFADPWWLGVSTAMRLTHI